MLGPLSLSVCAARTHNIFHTCACVLGGPKFQDLEHHQVTWESDPAIFNVVSVEKTRLIDIDSHACAPEILRAHCAEIHRTTRLRVNCRHRVPASLTHQRSDSRFSSLQRPMVESSLSLRSVAIGLSSRSNVIATRSTRLYAHRMTPQ